MIAIGLGLVWVSYAVGMYGYILIRGYDVPFTALFKGSWPGGKAPSPAPPAGKPATGTTQAPGTTTAGGRG